MGVCTEWARRQPRAAIPLDRLLQKSAGSRTSPKHVNARTTDVSESDAGEFAKSHWDMKKPGSDAPRSRRIDGQRTMVRLLAAKPAGVCSTQR